jgi:hypothetical protein
MALIKAVSENTFDEDAIQGGACIRAKRTGWDDFKNGIITSVAKDTITALYFTNVGNASNYFSILADEVAAGLWQIYWSQDMVTVNTEGVSASA